MLEKTEAMNRLLDRYGRLLTDKQLSYMIDYYEEDLSLGEIAENHAVSRQAIYDSIKKTEQLLTRYEEVVGLLSLEERQEDLVKRLRVHQQKHYPSDQTFIQLVDALDQLTD